MKNFKGVIKALWNLGNFWLRLALLLVLVWPALILGVGLVGWPLLTAATSFLPLLAGILLVVYRPLIAITLSAFTFGERILKGLLVTVAFEMAFGLTLIFLPVGSGRGLVFLLTLAFAVAVISSLALGGNITALAKVLRTFAIMSMIAIIFILIVPPSVRAAAGRRAKAVTQRLIHSLDSPTASTQQSLSNALNQIRESKEKEFSSREENTLNLLSGGKISKEEALSYLKAIAEDRQEWERKQAATEREIDASGAPSSSGDYATCGGGGNHFLSPENPDCRIRLQEECWSGWVITGPRNWSWEQTKRGSWIEFQFQRSERRYLVQPGEVLNFFGKGEVPPFRMRGVGPVEVFLPDYIPVDDPVDLPVEPE